MNRKLKKAVTLRTTDDLVNAARALWPDLFKTGDWCGLPTGIEKSLAKELKPDANTLLDRWLNEHNIDICGVGRRKLVKHAADYTTWKQYFKARWDDGDGIRAWFLDYCQALCGIRDEKFDHDKLHSFGPLLASATGKPFYSWSGPGDLTRQSWAPWPFPPKTKKHVAKKTAKRKARR